MRTKSVPFLVPMLVLLACGSPAPTPHPFGLEPTFAVGPTFAAAPTYAIQPTFALTPAPDPGRLIFTSKGCAGCHSIKGISTETDGPDLTNIATVATTRKPFLTAEDYIKESIEDPGAFVVEGWKPLMPVLADGLTERELEDLVDFLLNQW